MFEESYLKGLADKALSFTSGFQAEVTVSASNKALTRFGESVITQNVSSRGVGLSVRLLKDGRMGKASTGNISDDGIRRCVETARSALGVSEKNPELLPVCGPQRYQPIERYHQTTVETSPEARADGVRKAVETFEQEGLEGAGIFSNGGSGLGIATSEGLWASHRSTNAVFSISAMSPDSSGWAEETAPDVNEISIDEIAGIAARKALDGRGPDTIEPGAWTVVFEPAAVADILLFLGWEALNGLALVEGRSCLSDKVGQKLLGDNITIMDDAYHPLTAGQPFDYEGMPRQRVMLIENGVFRSAVHDRSTAQRAGLASTGHALPQPNSNGPVPLNLVLSPGDSSLEGMIGSTGKGLLVTRLHYSNILDPMKMTLTGMTRDGLFMIEDGRVTGGVKNMRFTESVLHLLSNVEALSKQLYKTGTFWGGGGTVAPAIKVNDFHFTSKTEN